MRCPASEKLEIIRLVEQSHLPVRKTLEKLGVSRAAFYRWYNPYPIGGLEALEDKPSRPSRVWNRLPDKVCDEIVQLALGLGGYFPHGRKSSVFLHVRLVGAGLWPAISSLPATDVLIMGRILHDWDLAQKRRWSADRL